MDHTGWKCPECRNCYSPFVQQCPYCTKAFINITGTSTDGSIALPFSYQIQQESCAIEQYFKDHPNETSVNLCCSCSRCSPRC